MKCVRDKEIMCSFDDETESSSSSDSSGSTEDATLANTITHTSSSNNSAMSQDRVRVFSKCDYSGYDHADEYFELCAAKHRNMMSINDVEMATTTISFVHGSDDSDKYQELILFGYDFSYLSPPKQFFLCAFGVFFFTLVYGYLQELIQIHIAGRQYALFLATCQFGGYTFWSAVLALLRNRKLRTNKKITILNNKEYKHILSNNDEIIINNDIERTPLLVFFAMAFSRSIDLGLTNLSMRYLNYPAKTLIKCSRVIFTMIMGIIMNKKKYSSVDYAMVIMLVCGLGMFLHADMTSNAIFHPVGVAMLLTSLSLDGTVSNWSEMVMNRQKLGQDEFHMKLYFFSFIIMFIAAYQMDEIKTGMQFFFQTHGTMSEVQDTTNPYYTWSIHDKTIALGLFSTIGIFGGSCACAITKRFGALAMSVTTTARKATTIFLSFALFPNACSAEHIIGALIFIFGLLLKGGLCNEQSTSKLLFVLRKFFSYSPPSVTTKEATLYRW